MTGCHCSWSQVTAAVPVSVQEGWHVSVGTFVCSGPGEVSREDSPYPISWFAATGYLNPSFGNRPDLGTFPALLWMFSWEVSQFVSHVLVDPFANVWREAAWAIRVSDQKG